jgi:SAM-dependent methyltransferase
MSHDAVSFWKQHGGRFAEVSRSQSSPYARRTTLVADLVEEHAGVGSALDIGCGAGQLSLTLAGRGFDVYGIDISEAQISAALRNADGIVDLPERRFLLCEADKIPLEGRFRAVTAIGVLPYVQDQRAFISRAADVLDREGILVLSVTRNASLFTLQAIFRHFRDFAFSRGWLTVFANLSRTGIWSGGFVDRPTGVCCRSGKSLRQLCRDLGFIPVASVDLYHLEGSIWDRSPRTRRLPHRILARALAWCHVGVFRLGGRHAEN